MREQPPSPPLRLSAWLSRIHPQTLPSNSSLVVAEAAAAAAVSWTVLASALSFSAREAFTSASLDSNVSTYSMSCHVPG